jgi:hypothetical protein
MPINLSTDMNVKTVITFILGLAFQFAQVLPGAVVTSDCQAVSESCECCQSAKSCECAKNGDIHQKPSPTPLKTGDLLKAPAAKSGETHVSMEPCGHTRPDADCAVAPRAGQAVGYRGIRLSVAFCTFVI